MGHLVQTSRRSRVTYSRRRLHNLPGQPVPGLHHPQREEVLPHVQLELPLLRFVPIAPCPVAGHHCKESGPVLLTPTCCVPWRVWGCWRSQGGNGCPGESRSCGVCAGGAAGKQHPPTSHGTCQAAGAEGTAEDTREAGEGCLQKKGHCPASTASPAAPQPPAMASSLKTAGSKPSFSRCPASRVRKPQPRQATYNRALRAKV